MALNEPDIFDYQKQVTEPEYTKLQLSTGGENVFGSAVEAVISTTEDEDRLEHTDRFVRLVNGRRLRIDVKDQMPKGDSDKDNRCDTTYTMSAALVDAVKGDPNMYAEHYLACRRWKFASDADDDTNKVPADDFWILKTADVVKSGKMKPYGNYYVFDVMDFPAISLGGRRTNFAKEPFIFSSNIIVDEPHNVKPKSKLMPELKWNACWDSKQRKYLVPAGTKNVTIEFEASKKPRDYRDPDGPKQNVYIVDGVRYNEY